MGGEDWRGEEIGGEDWRGEERKGVDGRGNGRRMGEERIGSMTLKDVELRCTLSLRFVN